MASSAVVCVALLVVSVDTALAVRPAMHFGRPRGGFMPPPVHTPTKQQLRAPLLWFNQTVDHFNPQDARIFKQQYMVNDTFWAPDGPIFLLLGGEGPASPAWLAHETAIIDYAETFGAAVVQLEHRFYGKSQPFDDLSLAHLQYLTSTQALADVATFLPWFKSQHKRDDATVIVFGGSYSGALAAWARQKYPHLIAGAIASSAPVLAKLNFVEYQEVVTQSLRRANNGAQCIQNIANGMKQITDLLSNPENRSDLATQFKTSCTSDLSDPLDQMNFLASIAGNFDGVVQYNRDNREFEGGAAPPTTDDLCALMTKGGQSNIERLVAVNNLLLGNESCFDVSYNNMISELKNISLNGPTAEGGRQWTYQTCTEFGYYQSTDGGNKQIFGTGFPLSFSTQQCQDIYNLTGPNIQWTNEFYGGVNTGATNIFFVNGDIDPWHALSVLKDLSPTVRAILISGTAHCANMYPPSNKDLPGLRAARLEIEGVLGSWVI